MLIKAESDQAAKPTGTASAVVPPPTPGEKAATATMYELDADIAKLNPHVGHKVEVVGTQAGSASPDSMPILKVESVEDAFRKLRALIADRSRDHFAYCLGFASNFALQTAAQK